MSAEESAASSSSSEQEEEAQAPEAAPVKLPDLLKVPDGFTQIPASEGPLDVATVRGGKNMLVLIKLPPNFDVKALHGKSIRMKKAVDSAGAVGTVELDAGNFSLIATSTEEYARCVNAFPSGRNGYRLGRPFAAGLTLVSTPDLPPAPSAEAASDGGGARDKPRSHPPLKLRWRPPGATVAPPAPPIPESIKRKQKRLSVHFDQATKAATATAAATPVAGKRASEAAAEEAGKKAKSPKGGSGASPEAESKQKKHKASPSATPQEADKGGKREAKSKSPSSGEAAAEAVVSPPPSKKSRSKERD